MVPKIFNLPSQYVSETEEEDLKSDSSGGKPNNNNKKTKLKVMSLGHLSQLINKKIFSDDFDKVSFDGLQKKTAKVGGSSTID